jgi:arylsulfatase A-like enzyme
MVEAGTAVPFIVNGPGLAPSGVVTDALTDFTDMLPTFAELAGAELDPDFIIDGTSIAPFILGEAEDTGRDWILSVGGHPAAFRDNRVVPAQAYDDRVIRNRRWKLWIGTDRQPEKLFDMENDPWETTNLINSDDPAARAAKAQLWSVIEEQPAEDAAPRYRPNPPQPWDRFDYVQP